MHVREPPRDSYDQRTSHPEAQAHRPTASDRHADNTPSLHQGSIHKGVIKTIRPFGCFVSIQGYRRDVLIHHSALSDEIKLDRSDDDDSKVKAMEFFFPTSTQVFVKITGVEEQGKVNGSIRAVDQETGLDLGHDPGGRNGGGAKLQDEPPEVGSIHKATVKRIEAYGVFVQLEGYRRQGLVHASQVSSYLSFSREDPDEVKKAELAGVVAIGDMIWIKVVEVDDDGSGRGVKIGCSLKVVDQTTGEDLDPTGLRYKPRREGGGGGRGAVALGANAGEVGRGGKIDWGYLEGEKKLYVGDHEGKYKLLDDEGPPAMRGGGEQLPPPPPARREMEPEVLPRPPPGPRTVEEALAIIEEFNKRKEDKKKKKDKKSKKSKSKKDKKEKKDMRRKERRESTSGSDSDLADEQLLDKS